MPPVGKFTTFEAKITTAIVFLAVERAVRGLVASVRWLDTEGGTAVIDGIPEHAAIAW